MSTLLLHFNLRKGILSLKCGLSDKKKFRTVHKPVYTLQSFGLSICDSIRSKLFVFRRKYFVFRRKKGVSLDSGFTFSQS